MKNYWLLILILFFTNFGFTQNSAFTLFETAPLRLNPALAGTANAARITSQYEGWFGEIYNETYNGIASISFDQSFALKKGHRIGGGVQFYHDQFGTSKFSTRQVNFVANYQRAVATDPDKTNFLIVGINGGFNQKKIDFDDLQWGSQYNGNGFDPSLPSGEDLDDSSPFWNLGAGVVWKMQHLSGRGFEFGFAIDNINEPILSFTNTSQVSNLIPCASRVHLIVDFKVGERFMFQPKIRYWSEGANDNTIIGGNIYFGMGEKITNKFIIGGSIFRQNAGDTSNYPQFNLGFQTQNIQIMLGSLIFANPALQQAIYNSTHGTYQIALNYQFPLKEEKQN